MLATIICCSSTLYVVMFLAYPVLGDLVLDSNNNGVSNHLGQIADKMCKWEGRIAEKLDLTPADSNAIKYEHPDNLQLQK